MSLKKQEVAFVMSEVDQMIVALKAIASSILYVGSVLDVQVRAQHPDDEEVVEALKNLRNEMKAAINESQKDMTEATRFLLEALS